MLHFILTGNESYPVTFANITRNIVPSSLEYAIEISHWPFKTTRNTLHISMFVDVDPTVSFPPLLFLFLLFFFFDSNSFRIQAITTTPLSIPAVLFISIINHFINEIIPYWLLVKGNVRWMQVTVNDVSLYGSFLDYALVDQKKKYLQVQSKDRGALISFILPHFLGSSNYWSW